MSPVRRNSCVRPEAAGSIRDDREPAGNVVYTSNIFALLGLRALYFVLADVVQRVHYLRAGLAAAERWRPRDLAVWCEKEEPCAVVTPIPFKRN